MSKGFGKDMLSRFLENCVDWCMSMTYKEKYMQCKTLDELMEIADSDVKQVMIFGLSVDRIEVIRKAAEEIANMKFNNLGKETKPE